MGFPQAHIIKNVLKLTRRSDNPLQSRPNHPILSVLYYIFDIPYHDGSALPFVAAVLQKTVKMYVFVFGPKFQGVAV